MKYFSLASILLLSVGNALAGGDSGNIDSPPWRQLEFQRKSMWGNASASINLSEHWRMEVSTSAGKTNREEVRLELADSNGAILLKTRYSQGRKDRRFKSFRYDGHQIERIRKNPTEAERELSPDQWSQQHTQRLNLEGLPADTELTTPYVLFLLASSEKLKDANSSHTVYVHTDYNVYQVELKNTGTQTANISYQLRSRDASESVEASIRSADVISLTVTPAFQPGRPDFEIMGLNRDIGFLIDKTSRLPLRIFGSAPTLGDTYMNLNKAVL